MNNYKYNWKGDKADKWRYQDEDLEDKYRDWMKEQETKDTALIKDIAEHEEKLRHQNMDFQIDMEHRAKENRKMDAYAS